MKYDPRVRPSRILVLGAGGVGCAIGGLLARAGCSVVLVARGAHGDVLRERGLTLRTPSWSDVLHVPVVASPREVAFSSGDVVLLAVKSQDTAAALADLAEVAPRDTPIVCAQNGVSNEGLAAEFFPRAHGMLVFLPATFLVPGQVDIHSDPLPGSLDVGPWPTGTDDLSAALASELRRAGFEACATPNISRLKYGKLLTNLVGAIQALLSGPWHESPWIARVEAEAVACFRAAGIAYATSDEIRARYARILDLPVAGCPRAGGSTWQSLARGASSIETDALNGEIVRLGEAWGVPTPVNRALVELCRRAVAERLAPGRMTQGDLDRALPG